MSPLNDIRMETTPDEHRLVERIVDRFFDILDRLDARDPDDDPLSVEMDLLATHLNGNPLDLQAMLDAERDIDLLHDIRGIERHLDRTTGKITRFFSPRFSKTNAAGDANRLKGWQHDGRPER